MVKVGTCNTSPYPDCGIKRCCNPCAYYHNDQLKRKKGERPETDEVNCYHSTCTTRLISTPCMHNLICKQQALSFGRYVEAKHWFWPKFHVWSSMPRSTTLLSSLIGVNLLHHSTYHGMFGSTYGETAFIAYTVDMQLLVEAELVVGITQKRKREEISSRVPLVFKEHIFSISFTTTITSIAASQPASSLADASQVISPKTIPPWYLYSPPGHSYCMQPPVQPSMHMLWSTNAVQMQAIYMYSHRLSGQQ